MSKRIIDWVRSELKIANANFKMHEKNLETVAEGLVDRILKLEERVEKLEKARERNILKGKENI